MTIENFIVHPDSGTDQRTDADLLAVRFSNREENLVRPMTDDPKVASCETYANIAIAEVKTGDCALNGPWTNPDDENMKRILKAVGCLATAAIEPACAALYRQGSYQDSMATIRMFAIGERKMELTIPAGQQITWDEVINFCIERFGQYRRQKASIGQWSIDGSTLKRLAQQRKCPEIREHFGLDRLAN